MTGKPFVAGVLPARSKIEANLAGIRHQIKRAPPRTGRLDLNEAIGEVIAIVRGELLKNHVSVQMRLAAEGDELTLSSFDYDVSAQAKVPVDTQTAGSALVSGRLLAEISRNLPGKPVQLTSDGGRAVLTCGSATFNLLTMPEDEYPALPEMPPAAGTIGSDAFATAVAQTAVAAGRDDTLPSLTGVRIEIEGDTLTLISTDRYRLAVP